MPQSCQTFCGQTGRMDGWGKVGLANVWNGGKDDSGAGIMSTVFTEEAVQLIYRTQYQSDVTLNHALSPLLHRSKL